MVYCKTANAERIAVHPMNNLKNTQWVEIVRHGEEPVFSVLIDDGTEEWFWEFSMTCPSDYERVKLNIFDAIFECDTMTELARMLDEIFNDGFQDILIGDEYEDCTGCKYCDG
jgi:hypothetical protein